MRTVDVVSRDGAKIEARVFSPESTPREALLFMPAMGAAPRIYDALGEALARVGVGVLIGDHRGGAASDVTPKRGVDFDYAHMLEHDWPALVLATREVFPQARVNLGGHSLGAHLASIYAGSPGAPEGALVIVAAGSVHYRAYPIGMRLRVLAGSRLIALIATVLGHHPGHRLGFGGRQTRGVMLDWSREAFTGRYSSKRGALDLEARLREVDRRTLALHVRGDLLAPEGTLASLLSRMPQARIERHDIDAPSEPKRLDPHFRWTRAPEPIAEHIAAFLRGM